MKIFLTGSQDKNKKRDRQKAIKKIIEQKETEKRLGRRSKTRGAKGQPTVRMAGTARATLFVKVKYYKYYSLEDLSDEDSLFESVGGDC